MKSQEIFIGRDVYRLNYKGEPNSILLNPNPGFKGYRYPKEYMPDAEDLAFPNMNEQQIQEFLTRNRYQHPRKLADGSWVALFMLATTWSICTDITRETPYAYRWCFRELDEAMYFLDNIVEFDEVPVRVTSLHGHRFDSGYARVIHYDDLGFRKW